MKIVSLQSVGLGNYFYGDEITYRPTIYNLGKQIENIGCIETGEEPTITEINFNYQYDVFPTYSFDAYTVHTSDGHIRVLPADKYIEEWSYDTDRISPDDIGNDIHEFLHEGDK